MKLVVKGLICATSYDIVPKLRSLGDGLSWYTKYATLIEKFKEEFDGVELEESLEDCDIIRKIKIEKECVIRILENYPIKPCQGDCIGIDGEKVFVSSVTCWEDGVVEVVTDKIVEDKVIGESLKDIKKRAQERAMMGRLVKLLLRFPRLVKIYVDVKKRPLEISLREYLMYLKGVRESMSKGILNMEDRVSKVASVDLRNIPDRIVKFDDSSIELSMGSNGIEVHIDLQNFNISWLSGDEAVRLGQALTEFGVKAVERMSVVQYKRRMLKCVK